MPGVTQIDRIETRIVYDRESRVDSGSRVSSPRPLRLASPATAARAADTRHGRARSTPASANLWPIYIAIENGFFDAADIKLDLVFAQSNASVIQQLAAGSFDCRAERRPGRSDPRHREGRADRDRAHRACRRRPMRCWPSPRSRASRTSRARPSSIGGAKDITRIFVERMLVPHGVKPGEFDYVFAGATSARFSALQVRRGRCRDPHRRRSTSTPSRRASPISASPSTTLPDMPFAGMAVNRAWAAANGDVLETVPRRLQQEHGLVLRSARTARRRSRS